MKRLRVLLIAVCATVAACSNTTLPSEIIDDLRTEPVVISDEARHWVPVWYDDGMPDAIVSEMTQSSDPWKEWQVLTVDERKGRFPVLWNDVLPFEYTDEHAQTFEFLAWFTHHSDCDGIAQGMMDLTRNHGLSLGDARFMAAAYLGVIRIDQPDWLLKWTTCDLAGEFDDA